ncbi:hypothetical protein ACS127_17960 [Amphibacillus sp. Q70]|uniref:hypothetical protein n=1 Tax=Amphibacillus sp. Q70 TaxID=3453416 RepID=UPI003F8687BF
MSDKVLLVFILDKIQYLDKLLLELKDEGIESATVINSTGMMQELSRLGEEQIISTLRPLFTPSHTENKTILMILSEDEVKIARSVINQVIGDLNQPETGILFALPLLLTDGIRDYDYDYKNKYK